MTGQGGGPEKSILLAAERADPARVAVTLCYVTRRGGPDLWVRARAAELGIEFHQLVERWALEPRTLPRLRHLLRTGRFHVIHSHDYKTDLFAFLLTRARGAGDRVAALATAHGWTGRTWRERLVYYPADKRLLARFAAVVAVSEEIRQELLANGASPQRVHTLLNAVEPTARRDAGQGAAMRASWLVDTDDFVVGAVGRLAPEKRLDILLAACAGLLRRHPRLRLVIAGDGELRGSLEARARESAIGSRCVFLGHRGDVQQLHQGFDLFVQASDYEGSPNAVLEAMVLETPIVATRVGGVPELVEHGVHALLVPPGDEAALGAAIEKVLAAPGEARRRAAAARARALERFSFALRQRRLEDLYRTLALQQAQAPRKGQADVEERR